MKAKNSDFLNYIITQQIILVTKACAIVGTIT